MPAEEKVQCLIIGATGLIGRRLGQLLTNNGISWRGTYHKKEEEGLVELDVTNPKGVRDIFSEFSPDAVFHCANLAGGVDFCESNPAAASDFHLKATKEIGNCCRESGALMAFMSTDYIFDGAKGSYREDDAPNPLNVYGRVKLKSEGWIKDNLERYLIIRTTNVYGWDPKSTTSNYMMNLWHRIKSGDHFNAPEFLWGSPTYVGDLAESLIELYIKKAAGIFHIVGNSFVNRYRWAIKACEVLGLDLSLIRPVKEPPRDMVRRPLKPQLNIEKFSNSHRTTLHDLRDGLNLMQSDINRTS